MKRTVFVCALLTLAVSGSRAQMAIPFPDFARQLAEIPKPKLTSIEDLCRALRESRDNRQLLDTLRSLDEWTRPVSIESEMLLVAALENAASNPTIDASVRAKAVDSLGRAAVRLETESRLRDALVFLADLVRNQDPMDSRRDLRFPALMGLTRAVHRIPAFDRNLSGSVLSAVFSVLRDDSVPQENVAAMLVVERYLASRGTGEMLRDPDLARGFESAVVQPLEAGLPGLYGDPRRPVEFRYGLIRVLAMAAWSRTIDDQSRMGHRCMQVLRNMEGLETDPQLRRLLGIYTRDRRW